MQNAVALSPQFFIFFPAPEVEAIHFINKQSNIVNNTNVILAFSSEKKESATCLIAKVHTAVISTYYSCPLDSRICHPQYKLDIQLNQESKSCWTTNGVMKVIPLLYLDSIPVLFRAVQIIAVYNMKLVSLST